MNYKVSSFFEGAFFFARTVELLVGE